MQDKNIDKNTEKEKLYKIGEFARKIRVNIQTLRGYDREGILCPKRSDTNRRGYTDEDFERVKIVLYLTNALSVNLNGVKIILKFLEKSRLKPALGLELLKNTAKSVGITDEEILNNLKRYNKEDLNIFNS